MNELRRATARTTGKVIHLDDGHGQATSRGVQGDSGAGDATAHDDDVKHLGLKTVKMIFSRTK